MTTVILYLGNLITENLTCIWLGSVSKALCFTALALGGIFKNFVSKENKSTCPITVQISTVKILSVFNFGTNNNNNNGFI